MTILTNHQKLDPLHPSYMLTSIRKGALEWIILWLMVTRPNYGNCCPSFLALLSYPNRE